MLAIFTTGGTIDKFYFDAKSEFCVGNPQIAPVLEEANVNFIYTIESILRKDSLDMTAADVALVCDKIQQSDAKRILVTHGTDTLSATAKSLKSRCCIDKTVVFIGAMQPRKMRDSDAQFNVGYGIAAAQLLSPGVYIAMNGCIFDPDETVKNRGKGRFEPSTDLN